MMSRKVGRTPAFDRWLLWLALLLPLVWKTWRYWQGAIYYGEYLHWTGLHSVHVLIVVLAISPSVKFAGKLPVLRWLMRRRRDLGLAAFAYACAHTLAYILRLDDSERVLEEALEVGLLTGWLALTIMIALALTSNDASVKFMRRGWRRLHQFIYPAALLVQAHWVLTAFDPTIAYLYTAIITAVLLARLRRTSAAGVRSRSD